MVAALWSSMRLLWPQWLVKLWLRGSAGRQRWCSWQLHCSAENFFMCSWCCLWCDLAFLSSSIWMIKSFPFGADWRGSQACWETDIRGKSAVGRLEVSVDHWQTWPEGGGKDKIRRNFALNYWVVELYTHSIPVRDPTSLQWQRRISLRSYVLDMNENCDSLPSVWTFASKSGQMFISSNGVVSASEAIVWVVGSVTQCLSSPNSHLTVRYP